MLPERKPPGPVPFQGERERLNGANVLLGSAMRQDSLDSGGAPVEGATHRQPEREFLLTTGQQSWTEAVQTPTRPTRAGCCSCVLSASTRTLAAVGRVDSSTCLFISLSG